jgi:arylsulfatase A-like enzyme
MRAETSTRPHIVLVTVDELDVEMMEIMRAFGFLPNIQTYVAAPGVVFSQSFVTNALGCPSRVTAMTGRYAHNHGVLSTDVPTPGEYGCVRALDDTATLVTWLQGAGYRTGHVGRYLFGYGKDSSADPSTSHHPAYIPPGWDDWQTLVDPSTYSMYGFTVNDNGQLIEHPATLQEYQTAVLAQRAQQFVQETLSGFPGQPLFLEVNPAAVNIELVTLYLAAADGQQYTDLFRWFLRPDYRDQTAKPLRWSSIAALPLLPSYKPSFNEADVSDKPEALRKPALGSLDLSYLTLRYRTRFAAMLAVDDLVGAVATALGPQRSNTMIVLTSDNGALLGEHRMGEKSVAYEESIRVPLYITGPGVAGGRIAPEIVLNNDLAPTIAEWAGLSPTDLDGRSLVPLLAGSAPSDWRKRLLLEHWSDGSIYDVPHYLAVRTGPGDTLPQRLYVQYYGNEADPDLVTDVELYDLTVDRYQLQSLHADPARAAERAALAAMLPSFASCGGSGQPSCQSLEQ